MMMKTRVTLNSLCSDEFVAKKQKKRLALYWHYSKGRPMASIGIELCHVNNNTQTNLIYIQNRLGVSPPISSRVYISFCLGIVSLIIFLRRNEHVIVGHQKLNFFFV